MFVEIIIKKSTCFKLCIFSIPNPKPNVTSCEKLTITAIPKSKTLFAESFFHV